MTSTEHAARRIFGERADLYTTSRTHADPAVLAEVARLAAGDGPGGGVALDVATGTGHTALALAPGMDAVIGIDLTAPMLAQARRLQAERGAGNVTWGLADAHRLPFAAATFDAVTCRRAAHHFADVGRALAEMGRVLRAGGRLAIDDRSVPEDDFVDACMNELDRLHDESHVRQYRASEWRRLLAAAGFAVREVRPYTQHRPLTSLTERVAAGNVARIHAILDALTADQRAALRLQERDGQLYLDHWYVTVGATKA